jgi:tetratricopeptide (TPR) repeat protein
VVLQPAPADNDEVLVVEFLAHGELTDERPGLAVMTPHGPVPSRLLSRGPGDLVRVAFQGAKNTPHYEVYYGGEAPNDLPRWTADAGLLLEARRFVECDLGELKSVTAAWDRAAPLGGNYVPQVFQGFFPFADPGTPALCRFTGRLHVKKPGQYRFYTSSHDASWLQIDGEMVVGWPGRHPPEGEARHFGDRPLQTGKHDFEYFYVSSGEGFLAVAAWKPPGEEGIVPIPPEAFGEVRRVPAARPQLRGGGTLPDFQFEVVGEAPLGKGRRPLLRVRFTSATPEQAHKWDFGDGQTATAKEPEHVFLLPGEYLVRCKAAKGPSIDSRIQVHLPRPPIAEKEHPVDIADWAGNLREYDAKRLPAPDLHQLVSVFVELEEFTRAASMGLEGLRQRSRGAVALEPQATARLCVELARLFDRKLNRQSDALAVCREGLQLGPAGEPLLQLLLATVDLCLKVDQAEDGDRHLQAAKLLLVETTTPELRSRLQQLEGDLFRRRHEPARAVESYQAAAGYAVSAAWDARQRTVLPGAYSRSIEEYLRTNDPTAAVETLDRWSAELPTCHLDGYYTLLRGKSYLALDQPRLAVLEATDLLGQAPDDPYADQLLLLVAEAQFRQQEVPAARGTLKRLLDNYPGSPLAATARTWLKDGFERSARPARTESTRPSRKEAREP